MPIHSKDHFPHSLSTGLYLHSLSSPAQTPLLFSKVPSDIIIQILDAVVIFLT